MIDRPVIVTNDDVMTRLLIIEEKLDNLIAGHSEVVTKVNDVLTNLAPHLEAVGPMIEALANNPMFKMLAGGGGKKK
jgi:hypothetical protein